jgi:hypothetical protein
MKANTKDYINGAPVAERDKRKHFFPPYVAFDENQGEVAEIRA